LGANEGKVGVAGGLVKCDAPGSKAMGFGAAGFGSTGAAKGLGSGAGLAGGADVGVGVRVGGAKTEMAGCKLRPCPKTLVTFSGTATVLCPERRASSAGLIAATICGNGRLTGVRSWLELSEKVPPGDPWRNSPKETLTAPDGSCARAVCTDKEKVPLPGAAAMAAKLGESEAMIGASGNWITPSESPTEASLAVTGVTKVGGSALGGGGAGAAAGVGGLYGAGLGGVAGMK
jgi:hypothetical protein